MSRLVPTMAGSGVGMRAGMVLEALASDFSVYLLVIPVRGETELPRLSPNIKRWCAGFSALRVTEGIDPAFRDEHHGKPLEYRYATRENIEAAASSFSRVRFQLLHVYRLFLAPFAEPYLRAAPSDRPFSSIDLDDYQSKSRGRLAGLFEARGKPHDARRERIQSKRFAEAEKQYLPRFDRVFMAGHGDASELAEEYGLDNVVVLPNATRLPGNLPRQRLDPTFTLLFLGTLDYYPNIDAVLYFCERILPHLRDRSSRPFRILIAGARPTAEVLQLHRYPEVTVLGEVSDVSACYAEADVAIVPLRGGGGTRIKILEAAAYRRPVVTTSLGAENLAVADGRELLIADEPEAFAQSCVRLMEDAELRRALSEKALRWVRSRHTLANVRAALRVG